MRPHTERCWGLFMSRCPSPALERGNEGQNEGESRTGCPGEEERRAPDRVRGRIEEDAGDTLDHSGRTPGPLQALNSMRNIPISSLQHPGFSPCEPFSCSSNDGTLLDHSEPIQVLLSLDAIGTTLSLSEASGTKWSEPFCPFSHFIPEFPPLSLFNYALLLFANLICPLLIMENIVPFWKFHFAFCHLPPDGGFAPRKTEKLRFRGARKTAKGRVSHWIHGLLYMPGPGQARPDKSMKQI